jgi:FkbM family methyltransferase
VSIASAGTTVSSVRSLERPHSCRPWPEVKRIVFETPQFSAPCGEIDVEGRSLRIVDSGKIPLKRLHSIFAKEPTTIPWIEAFTPDDVFVDIGANIGIYTVYAAAMVGCRVFAFEPEALNYAELCKNIFVNGLNERVTAFCAAMSDVSKLGVLYLGAFGYSYSHHDFDESTWTGDKAFGQDVTRADARLQQGCLSTTLDAVVASGVVPSPHHIKIDVDGLEHRVFDGMRETLRSPELQTVLIEIDFANPHSERIIGTMLRDGWKISSAQLRTNRKLILTDRQVEKIRRSGKGGFNYIFFRDAGYERLFEAFPENYAPPYASR